MTPFEQSAKEAMAEIVKTHQCDTSFHFHQKTYKPIYQQTRIEKSIIDSKNNLAAFVLFEQIDTDRLSQESEGFLGDQFRYSVWFIKKGEKPKQLYEDHAYIRPKTIYPPTGTRGRDCKISLDEFLDNGVIIEISTEEKRENDEYLRKKVLLDFNGNIKPIPKKAN